MYTHDTHTHTHDTYTSEASDFQAYDKEGKIFAHVYKNVQSANY